MLILVLMFFRVVERILWLKCSFCLVLLSIVIILFRFMFEFCSRLVSSRCVEVVLIEVVSNCLVNCIYVWLVGVEVCSLWFIDCVCLKNE